LKNVAFPTDVYRVELIPLCLQPEAEHDRRRIAVLPLTNISLDPKDEYFTDGMTEELISTISGISELNVISRTSVMGYKGTNKRIAEIGRELDVGSVLEGSVRKAENMIRVSIQLIYAKTDRHLWAQNYDGELKSIFKLQSDIAEKVAGALKIKLLSQEAKQLTKAPTTSTEAYTLYLRGKQLLNDGTDSSIRQALELFTGATKLDPSFARAYVTIGVCYAQLGIRNYMSFDESRSGMKSAAKRALQIDSDLAEAHALLSRVAWAEDDRVLDEIEARRAIELNPNLAEAQAMMGVLKATNGYPTDSVRLLEVAHSLDPLNSETVTMLGRMYIYTGREEEALKHFEKNAKVSPFPVSLLHVEFYLNKGELQKAENEIVSLEFHYPDNFNVLMLRGYLSALKGDRQEAERIMEKLRRNFAGGATLERNIGYIKYYLGDLDGFYDSMMRAAEEHVLDPSVLRYCPLFEKARRDPRFRQVLLKSKIIQNV
jgi:TolB-like protein/Tfp pilus assembly protein PilF